MNTLTEKQNLRYDLLKANNYDVKNAKACYDFVTAPEPQQAKTAANGLADGEYIPSLGELYFILLHIRDINAALEAIGGKPLCGWYWASTQYSATNAWGLYLYGGGANGGTKAAAQGRVRAVSAFLPLNS